MADHITELSSSDERHIGFYDTMEDDDVSSDPRVSEEDESGVEDLNPRPEVLEKRKASPDCIEETRSQKKIKQTK